MSLSVAIQADRWIVRYRTLCVQDYPVVVVVALVVVFCKPRIIIRALCYSATLVSVKSITRRHRPFRTRPALKILRRWIDRQNSQKSRGTGQTLPPRWWRFDWIFPAGGIIIEKVYLTGFCPVVPSNLFWLTARYRIDRTWGCVVSGSTPCPSLSLVIIEERACPSLRVACSSGGRSIRDILYDDNPVRSPLTPGMEKCAGV